MNEEHYLGKNGWRKGKESWGKPHRILSREVGYGVDYGDELVAEEIDPGRLSDFCLRTLKQAVKIQLKVDSLKR